MPSCTLLMRYGGAVQITKVGKDVPGRSLQWDLNPLLEKLAEQRAQRAASKARTKAKKQQVRC